MYLVIGNCPRKIELKDLNDSIYYKQQKIYSDVQYSASNDLKDAERKGLITVLQRTPEKGGSAELSFAAPVVVNPPNPNPSLSDKQVEDLSDRIRALEGSVHSLPPQQKDISSGLLEQLADKITKMEQSLQGGGNNAPTMATFIEAIKNLEDRIVNTQQSDDILRKLTSLINRSSVAPAAATAKDKEEVRPEEIYVPNVVVEDANTHVKLQVRTLESKSDDVGDALKALKNLKSKSK